ncbi:MAG: phytanoyl-CoA dioxygenase family protein [Bradymonadia bacterium]
MTANTHLSSAAVEHAATLPLHTRFDLDDGLTDVHRAFLAQHGFLVFGGVYSDTEVATMNTDIDRLRDAWVEEGRTSVNGIPLFIGNGPESEPLIQRMPFTSCFSKVVRDMIRDPRLEPIKTLIGSEVRIGDQEKDGCVVNTYLNVEGSVYPRLGWHTDGLRDVFYLRKPKQMLNVGIHLSDCPLDNGGLRLIPGSHEQSMFSMAFRKISFLDHRPDRNEIAVQTQKGDLTIHDGRLWHRVAQSTRVGSESFRRSMYVPYLTDEYDPKDTDSATPLYHRLGQVLRRFRGGR